MKERELFSTDAEPALHAERHFQADPAERKAALPGTPDELAALRDSVANEPFQPETAHTFYRVLDEKTRQYSGLSLFLTALAAGALGGLFAIPAAFFVSQPGWIGVVYIAVFGPAAEELLKQSGMLYLLELKPHRVARNWQFFVSALMGGLVFAAIENLVYGHVYLTRLPPEELERIMTYRRVVCTLLHVCCTMISALGLRHAWKRSRAEHAPFNVRYAFLYFFLAILVHGGYNFASIFFFT